MDENISIKERNRYSNRKHLDPNAEVNLIRKENERIQRENRNLLKSLHTQKLEFEVLNERIKKYEQSNLSKVLLICILKLF